MPEGKGRPVVSSPARVLVTRSARQGSGLAEHLRSLGLEPVLLPAIETVAPSSYHLLDTALAELEHFDWVLFTSANAVEALAHRLTSKLPHSKLPHSELKTEQNLPSFSTSPKLAAIGPATAQALQNLGWTPNLIPAQAITESLTDALLPYARQPDGSPTRFLFIRAEEAREHLPETLRTAGAEVTIAPAYRTVIPTGSADLLRTLLNLSPEHNQHRVPYPSTASPSKDGVLPPMPIAGRPRIRAITFTSSSTARNLLALCEAAGVSLPEAALRVSIGPITSQTLRDLGLPPHAEAPEATVASLAETVRRSLHT